MKKITHLDSLRGLAAFIVVFAHFAGAFYPFALFGGGYKPFSSLESGFHRSPAGILIAGHFAVCLFFVLSGYVLSHRFIGPDCRRVRVLVAAAKRPFRLGGMVVVTLLLSYLISLSGLYFNREVSSRTGSIPWFQSYWAHTPPPWIFLRDVLVFPFLKGWVYNPPMWTIKTELFGSFLVFACLFLAGSGKFRGSAAFRIAVLVLLMAILRHTLYVAFLFGILCAEAEVLLHQKKRVLPDPLLLAVFLAGLCIGSYPYYVDRETVAGSVYGLLPATNFGAGGYAMIGALLVFAAVLFYAPVQKILNRKLLVYFGRISYALYALHFILLGSVSSLLYLLLAGRIGHNPAFACTFVTSLALLILLADVTTRWVDEKVVVFSNRLSKRLEMKITRPESPSIKG